MEEPEWVRAITNDDFAKFEQLLKTGKVDFVSSKYDVTFGWYTPLGFAVSRGFALSRYQSYNVWINFMVALGRTQGKLSGTRRRSSSREIGCWIGLFTPEGHFVYCIHSWMLG
jgi:hypothetical protein